MSNTTTGLYEDVEQANAHAPMVSVIISTYNRTHYLDRALRSVLAQTFRDFEVLVCDDASSQDVPGLLKTFGDDRIQYLRNATNLGVAATNLVGYRAARGRYVAHLDDDDEWEPRFLEVLVGNLEAHPECSLAFCDDAIIDAESKVDPGMSRRGSVVWGRGRLSDGVHRPFYHIAVVDRAVPGSHASVIRRLALDLDHFTPDASYAWDLWLTYLACRDGSGAYFTSERLSRYRVHGVKQTGGVTDLRTYEALTYCDRHFLADTALRVDRRILTQRLAQTSAFWSVALVRVGQHKKARTVALSGVRVRVMPAGLAALALAMLPRPLGARLAGAATTVAVQVRQARRRQWQRAG